MRKTGIAGAAGVWVLAVAGAAMLSLAGCQPSTKTSYSPHFASLVAAQPRPIFTPRIVPPRPSAAIPVPPVAPSIHDRGEWAREKPNENRLEAMGAITRLTLHHEGMGIESTGPESEVEAQMRKIQAAHKERMGAGDIGYHFIIDCNGRIWEGRSLKYQGAHAGNGDANRGNIGVVLLGNFELQHPKPAQIKSMQLLVEYLQREYSIPNSSIYTHNEIRVKYGIGETDCPGRYLQAEVDSMRGRLVRAAKAATNARPQRPASSDDEPKG